MLNNMTSGEIGEIKEDISSEEALSMIHDMTSDEIRAFVHAGSGSEELVSLTEEQALAIIGHPNYDNLDEALTDWVWETLR